MAQAVLGLNPLFKKNRTSVALWSLIERESFGPEDALTTIISFVAVNSTMKRIFERWIHLTSHDCA